jgi:hypothetical protein
VTSIQNLNGEALDEIMYLPAGTASVYASVNGSPQTVEVHVNALTARLLQSDLEELLGAQVKPFIDFDHKGGGAAADPKRELFGSEAHRTRIAAKGTILWKVSCRP